MGEFGRSLAAYIQAYRKVLTISAIIILVISIALLIAGGVLVGTNRSFFDFNTDTQFEEDEAKAKKLFAGFALLGIGCVLFIVTASMGCTILECGIFGKLVEKGNEK
nr:hypothetical protein HmN_000654200 [Hymenolepis microstoma]